MKHNAIRKAYPEVVTIDDALGCFDANNELVKIEKKKVDAADLILQQEIEAEIKLKATRKAELLARLGITDEEAQILLS